MIFFLKKVFDRIIFIQVAILDWTIILLDFRPKQADPATLVIHIGFSISWDVPKDLSSPSKHDSTANQPRTHQRHLL